MFTIAMGSNYYFVGVIQCHAQDWGIENFLRNLEPFHLRMAGSRYCPGGRNHNRYQSVELCPNTIGQTNGSHEVQVPSNRLYNGNDGYSGCPIARVNFMCVVDGLLFCRKGYSGLLSGQ